VISIATGSLIALGPTCADCPIVEHPWPEFDSSFIEFVIGWRHPGWAWSTYHRWYGDERCEASTPVLESLFVTHTYPTPPNLIAAATKTEG
jgi:hypothetical protein